METIKHDKVKFLSYLQRDEPAARDSTAMRAAKKCKRYYFLTIVCHRHLKPNEKSGIGSHIPMDFGSAYHKFRDVLEKTNEITTGMVAARKVWHELQPEPPHIESRWAYLHEAKLIESCMIGYAHRNRQKKIGNVEVVSSEQVFDILMKDGKTRSGGLMDQVNRINGQPWPRDFKTTGKTDEYWQRFCSPSDQPTRYIHGLTKLTGEKVPGLVLEVLRNKKPTKKDSDPKPEIIEFLATRTPSQLDRWEDEQIFLEGELDRCRDQDMWPQADDMTMCQWCDKRMLCTQSSELSIMAKLDKYYTHKIWDFKSLHQEDAKNEKAAEQESAKSPTSENEHPKS